MIPSRVNSYRTTTALHELGVTAAAEELKLTAALS
jgi:hypothetical protein